MLTFCVSCFGNMASQHVSLSEAPKRLWNRQRFPNYEFVWLVWNSIFYQSCFNVLVILNQVCHHHLLSSILAYKQKKSQECLVLYLLCEMLSNFPCFKVRFVALLLCFMNNRCCISLSYVINYNTIYRLSMLCYQHYFYYYRAIQITYL